MFSWMPCNLHIQQKLLLNCNLLSQYRHTLKIIIATFLPCPPVLQYLKTLQMSTCFYKLSKVHNSQLPMHHHCFLNVKIATSWHITLYICILQETELPRVSGVCVAAPSTVQRWFGRYSLPEEEEGGGGGVEHSSPLLSWQISPLFHPQVFVPWYAGDSKLSLSLRSD